MPRLASNGMPPAMTTRQHYLAQCRAREAEERRLNIEKIRLRDKAVSGLAMWENKTASVIESNLIMNRVEERKRKHLKTLESRRKRLANLLQSEEEQYRLEIASTFETTEERRLRLKDRALELRAEREQQRIEFVNHAREQQWRNTCDDLRTRDSKLTAVRIAKYDRKEQLEILERQRKEEMDFDSRYAKEYENQRLHRIKVEEDKKRHRAEEDRKIKHMLDIQMQERHEILSEEQKDREDEAAALKAQWKADQEQKLLEEKLAAEASARQRTLVMEFNRAKRSERDKIASDEREFDERLLREALEREAADAARDKAEADARKLAIQEYQRHLAAQLIKDKDDTSKLDVIRNAQLEAEWKKREDQWKKESDAREQLMREVHAERQLQLRLKSEATHRNIIAEERIAKEALRRVKEEDEAERRKQMELKRERIAHQDDLKSQIKVKEDIASNEKQQAYAEYLMMRNAEAKYQDALEKLLTSTQEEKSFARKKNQWYG